MASPPPPRSGPIGVLCIQRTLACGRLVGLVTGLGAASSFLTVNQIPIHLGGGLFLIYQQADHGPWSPRRRALG